MNASVVLGDEHDDALRARLMSVLQRLGGRIVGGPERSLAGSQDLEEMEVEIGGQRLRVEAETYIGLTLSGPDSLIRKVQALLATADRPRSPADAGSTQISWNGAVIGVMSAPKVDNFFVYGPWKVTCASDVYAAFVHEIDQTGDLVVTTLSNGRTGAARVLTAPDGEIQLRFDPSLGEGPG